MKISAESTTRRSASSVQHYKEKSLSGKFSSFIQSSEFSCTFEIHLSHVALSCRNLSTLQPKHSTESFGGAVWALAADHAGERLAAACEDGTVRLFNVADNNVDYVRALPKQKGKRFMYTYFHFYDKHSQKHSHKNTCR